MKNSAVIAVLYLTVTIESSTKNHFYTQLVSEEFGCKWTWETIQLYTETQIKVKNGAFIAVLHLTVTVGSSIMSITHTLKWVWNGPRQQLLGTNFLLLINATSGQLCHSGVIWCRGLYIPGYQQENQIQVKHFIIYNTTEYLFCDIN